MGNLKQQDSPFIKQVLKNEGWTEREISIFVLTCIIHNLDIMETFNSLELLYCLTDTKSIFEEDEDA